jgi:ankyrin repeat protein
MIHDDKKINVEKYDAATTRPIFSVMNKIVDARNDKLVLGIARTGDIDLLESILKHGDILDSYNFNYGISYGVLPLLECATDKPRAKALIKDWLSAFGGRNKSTMNDFLPAVKDVDVLRGLLTMGADPNRITKSDDKNFTPIRLALDSERTDLVISMMEHLLRLDEIPLSYKGRSLFCDLSTPDGQHKTKLVEKVVRHFENMELPDSWRKRIGTGMLHETKKPDDPHRTQKFLSGSGKVGEVQISLMSMASMTSEGWTTLLSRCKKSKFPLNLVDIAREVDRFCIDDLKVKVVENMARDGVDIDSILILGSSCPTTCYTLLHAAVANDNPTMTAALLAAGANPDKTVFDNGSTFTDYDINPVSHAALRVLHAWRAKQAIENVLSKAHVGSTC